METLGHVVKLLDELLKPEKFKDYCPNGLQVEGAKEIKKVVTGVTASLALIDAAIERGAEAIIVHHGYFWKGESAPITGLKKVRMQRLLQHDISLIAYHLPLDAHPEFGNNAQLAKVLDLEVKGGMDRGNPLSVGLEGNLNTAQSATSFARHIQKCLGREPLHVAPDSGREADTIQSIAWCTGGAQGFIEQAVSLGVDAYLTGEVSEQTVHIAREAGIHFYAAGHHATERYGAKSVGEYIARQTALEVEFVDIPNPA